MNLTESNIPKAGREDEEMRSGDLLKKDQYMTLHSVSSGYMSAQRERERETSYA